MLDCMSNMGIMMSGMAIVGVIWLAVVAIVAVASIKYLPTDVELAAIPVRNPRGAVGRMALLCTGMGVAEEPKPEHVHSHRARNRCSMGLQHRGHLHPTAISVGVSDGGWRSFHLFRSCGRHHGSGAARAGARAAGARKDVRRHTRAADLAPKTAMRVKADGTDESVPLESVEVDEFASRAPR